MALGTDVFLSHNWGLDESGRNNHYRVSLINKALKAHGYQTWFDEDCITGDIVEKMSTGIEQAKCFIVFITRKYHDKVNGIYASDNCQLEFKYASRIKTKSKMVVVVMDKCMLNPYNWTGSIGMHLGGEMYVDMSGDLGNTVYLSQQIKLLEKELMFKGIRTLSGIFCFHFTFYCDGGKSCGCLSTKLSLNHN